MRTLDELLEDLASGDDRRVHEAVKACSRRLREGEVDDRFALAKAVAPLAAHGSDKIRQAVAGACEMLPDPMAEQTLSVLLGDDDQYVVTAAKAATDLRSARRKATLRDDAEEQRLAELLEQITSKHGKAARRLAGRIAAREREIFVRKLHHELAKIVSPLDMSLHQIEAGLSERRRGVDRPGLVQKVRTARERLAFLWSIIDSARRLSTTPTPSFEEERLAELVDLSHGHLLDRLGRRAAHVVLANDVPRDVVVMAHRHSLLQAFQNVLQNAVEAYAEDAPRIEVVVSVEALPGGSHVALSFVDRGSGMSAEQKERLFEPFLSKKPGGTGVGLLVVRKMVEEVHGGTLWLESEEGVGTTVKMTLPVRGARSPGR